VTSDELLADVLRRYEHSPDPRLREVTEAAIRHLHAFACEVRLDRDEWRAGIDFLTEAGQLCDESRQELILLSDTLGLSTLVELLAHAGARGTTDNTVLGPFYVPGAPWRARGESMLVDDDPGERVVVRGRVCDQAGTPLGDATLDAWQNASNGFYACQQPGVQSVDNLRGRYRTGPDGSYELRSIRPVPYPIPDDGPAGAFLKAHRRNWWRPGHLHLWVTAPGCKDLITHVFDEDSDYLDDDAVFGVQRSLVRRFEPDEGGELATRFDIVVERLP
jgi:hydroxyquinol 1,2-dioxygenase